MYTLRNVSTEVLDAVLSTLDAALSLSLANDLRAAAEPILSYAGQVQLGGDYGPCTVRPVAHDGCVLGYVASWDHGNTWYTLSGTEMPETREEASERADWDRPHASHHRAGRVVARRYAAIRALCEVEW